MNLTEAHVVLGLSGDPGTTEVREAWRQGAARHHPDRGGDPAAFHRCREAFLVALAAAEAPRSCHTCSGAGSTQLRHLGAFNALLVTCAACGGSGVIDHN